MDTSVRLYDDFIRFLFLHTHREASALTNELKEESDQNRFLRPAGLTHLKGSVGLILTKGSVMRISIPLDLSSPPVIPLSRFIRSGRPTPLLDPSLVLFLRVLPKRHSWCNRCPNDRHKKHLPPPGLVQRVIVRPGSKKKIR